MAAVLAAGRHDVVDAVDKVQALEEIRKSPDFPALAVAFKRVINISRGAEAGEWTNCCWNIRRSGCSWRPPR